MPASIEPVVRPGEGPFFSVSGHIFETGQPIAIAIALRIRGFFFLPLMTLFIETGETAST